MDDKEFHRLKYLLHQKGVKLYEVEGAASLEYFHDLGKRVLWISHAGENIFTGDCTTFALTKSASKGKPSKKVQDSAEKYGPEYVKRWQHKKFGDVNILNIDPLSCCETSGEISIVTETEFVGLD